ncbi:Type I secretion system membrane fusion protein PrsE [Roseobacter fucihabitans]|uniref:Membrane fusion protein (MFP) family protein n=1 Tax=Roseobacter fucihabitans TaxID=1537242 RepID=A0ABZ2BRF8_9RHOB|nr:HlyD family type I secretion periplasmic adaptor subunit [Roseobacter litoralis]MBC6966649.1 Type I secretion system membrane fusion protein PrsE [Roseobacter litoralis]
MSGSEWNFEQDPAAPRAGRGWFLTIFLILLVAFAALAIAWASWARVEIVARATGVVVPSGRARNVESLEGGIVRDILISEGDTVEAGEVLIRIDDIGAAASMGEITARRDALRARAMRLEAELLQRNAPDFSGLDLASDHPLALRELALFDSRKAADLSQRTILMSQVSQRAQEIEELTSSLARIDESLTLLDEEIQLRSDSGVVPRAQIIPIERERTVKRQERDGVLSRRAQAKTALGEAEARVLELNLNRRAEINAERSETLNELSIIDETLKRASDVLARTSLRAPVGGIISVLNVNTLGSVIAPGEEVARIVPAGDKLEVEARVRPEDIAFIRLDLPAKVKLTSFDFTIYGALDGTVVRIGADAERDETTGETYFPIIVRTDTNTLRRNNETNEIRTGMIASIDILTGERTVLDYLLKPLRKARLEALRER